MGANILILLSLSLLYLSVATNSLKVNYYADSCPNVERIVQKYVTKEIREKPSMAPSLLRLHFHDCFVSGCDASILLNGSHTEKSAYVNLNLRGYDFIDAVKKLLEEKCPKTVSCADIISLVARDAIVTICSSKWDSATNGVLGCKLVGRLPGSQS
ncbi:peroxidase [Ranunculus cassubicifolius]